MDTLYDTRNTSYAMKNTLYTMKNTLLRSTKFFNFTHHFASKNQCDLKSIASLCFVVKKSPHRLGLLSRGLITSRNRDFQRPCYPDIFLTKKTYYVENLLFGNLSKGNRHIIK